MRPSASPTLPGRRIAVTALAGLAALLYSQGSAWAQATPAKPRYPDKLIRVIVPFTSGGGVDDLARLIAKQLQAQLSVPVVVENRPGANGTTGGKAVQTAAADGYTLLFSASTHVLARDVLAAPPYDPLTDFTPIARVGEAPLLLVAAPTAPKTLPALLNELRSQTGPRAAIPALGSPSHLAALQLARLEKLPLSTQVFKGTTPAVVDVAMGRNPLLLDSVVSILPVLDTVKVTPLLVTSHKRVSRAPHIPTAAEAGLPGLQTSSWYGFWAPKALPEERVQLLNREINLAIQQLGRQGTLATYGLEPVQESPADFQRYASDYQRASSELLRAVGYTPQ